MTSPPLALFRLDAGAAIGLGHAMRCLALAGELVERGWRVRFATNPGARAPLEAIASGAGAVEFLEAEGLDAPSRLCELTPDGCDVLVVDHYGCTARHESAWRSFAPRIAVIDDLADRPHDADLLIDTTYGRAASDYQKLLPPEARVVTGAAYALLAPRFPTARPAALRRRERGGPVRAVLVTLGGAPPWAMLERLARIARAAAPDAVVDIAAGASDAPTRVDDPKIRVHRGRVDVAGLTAGADLGIGAGGSSSWERCCLGLPTVLVEIADNQAGVAAALGEAGAVERGGWLDAVTDEDLIALTKRLVEDSDRRRAMARRAAAICDGLGARRAAGEIAALLDPPDARVTLRPASLADGETMLAWQHAPGVRRFAKNPEPPGREEHFAWLERRLDDPLAGPFEVIEVAGAPAGVLRLDRVPPEDDSDIGESYRVNILVAPEFQGCGAASRALALAGRMAPDSELIAEVLEGNDASHRLFRGARYVRVGPEEYHRPPLRSPTKTT